MANIASFLKEVVRLKPSAAKGQYVQRGDLGKSREYWEKARGMYKKIGMPNMIKKVEGWIEKIKEK